MNKKLLFIYDIAILNIKLYILVFLIFFIIIYLNKIFIYNQNLSNSYIKTI